MTSKTRYRLIWAVVLSLFMSHAPQVALAQAQLLSTTQVVESLSRVSAQKELENQLSAEDVRKILAENGVSQSEIQSRIASLTESEMRELSGQISQARAGGDILVTILLVVLIIFLIKRI